jgi:ADP-ribose pyrophosphatase
MTEENNRRVLAEGKYVRLVVRGRWEWAERTNTSHAVVIVAVTSDRQMVLIEEYRHPLGVRVVEMPAGLVGDEPGTGEEELIEAAKRELLEEAGCVSDNWHHLIDGPSSPGLTNETYTMFMAGDAKKINDGGGDDSEDIHVCLVPLDSVETWLDDRRRQGLLVDPKVYSGLFFAMKLNR